MERAQRGRCQKTPSPALLAFRTGRHARRMLRLDLGEVWRPSHLAIVLFQQRNRVGNRGTRQTGARRAWRQSNWGRRLQPTAGGRRACTALSIPRRIAHRPALRPKTEIAHYALIELAKASLNAKLHADARGTVTSLGAQDGHSPPGLDLGPIKDLVECRTALDAPDPCAPFPSA